MPWKNHMDNCSIFTLDFVRMGNILLCYDKKCGMFDGKSSDARQ